MNALCMVCRTIICCSWEGQRSDLALYGSSEPVDWRPGEDGALLSYLCILSMVGLANILEALRLGVSYVSSLHMEICSDGSCLGRAMSRV